MDKVSLYADAPALKRGQKFVSLLTNLTVTAILSVILYFGLDAIVSSAGGFQSDADSLTSKEKNLYSVIEETGLGKKDSTGNFKSNETLANEYAISLSLGSLLQYGESKESLSKSVYGPYESAGTNNDMLYSYYVSFKESHNDDFAQEALASKGESYYIPRLTKDHEDWFLATGYPYLLEEKARDLDEALRNPSYSKGVEVKNFLKTRYASLLEEAIEEVTKSYTPYKESFKEYTNAYRLMQQKKAFEALGGFALAVMIHYFLVPLGFKNGRTLVDRLQHRPYRKGTGKEPTPVALLIHALLIFLEGIGIPGLSMILVYGSQGVDILSLQLFNTVPLFSIMLFSLLLLLVSYTFSFMNKDKKQTLSELVSNLIQVDGREIDEY